MARLHVGRRTVSCDPATGDTLLSRERRDEIEQFIFFENRLLDERRFEDWMELFTEDGYYWAPARPGQESPLDETSLFFDDRELMQARFRRLRHPRIHVQTPPSRTCHMVGNLMIDEADDAAGSYLTSSCFQLLEFRRNRQRTFGGRYEHRLVRRDGALCIALKKATLINCDSVFDALAIPF